MNDTRKDIHPRLPLGISLLLTLSLAFFMSFSAFTEVKIYRYMVVLVFVLLLFIAVRSKLVTVLAALPCLLAFLGAESSFYLPLVLSAVAVIGFGGFALHAVHPLIVAAAPPLAYFLAFGITGDPIGALSVLCFVPVAIVVALALHFKLSRTASIAATSVAVFVCGAAALLLALPKGVTLSAETITAAIESLKNFLAAELLNENSPLALAFSGVTDESLALLLAKALIRLLPGMLIVTIEVFAYFACLIAVSLRSSQLPDHPLPTRCLAFRMSAVSAILFFICLALSLTSFWDTGNSDVLGVILVTAMNLLMILLPGLAVCGALSTLASFYQKRRFPSFFLIILLLWFAYLLPTILAFAGAIAILRTEKNMANLKEN